MGKPAPSIESRPVGHSLLFKGCPRNYLLLRQALLPTCGGARASLQVPRQPRPSRLFSAHGGHPDSSLLTGTAGAPEEAVRLLAPGLPRLPGRAGQEDDPQSWPDSGDTRAGTALLGHRGHRGPSWVTEQGEDCSVTPTVRPVRRHCQRTARK